MVAEWRVAAAMRGQNTNTPMSQANQAMQHNKQTSKQANKQASKQTNKQANNHSPKLHKHNSTHTEQTLPV